MANDTTYTYKYAEKSIVPHTVTFKVENGSWNDGTADDIIVTLSGYEDEASLAKQHQNNSIIKTINN